MLVGGPENNFTLLISPQKKNSSLVNSPNFFKNNILIHICKLVASISNTYRPYSCLMWSYFKMILGWLLQLTLVTDITYTKKSFSQKNFMFNPVLLVKFGENQFIKLKKFETKVTFYRCFTNTCHFMLHLSEFLLETMYDMIKINYDNLLNLFD